ncbi:putative virus X resistance protein-like, coiled-coil [Helianthus annuus]|uniref:Putative NB-ARC n=1 Tax=Helianthus annuus TaxID=4232 RepID=A0A251U0S6_HELAN|nr:putative virus X resistance protein-like, coiled-coil [Helianthus annuus]KAJ0544713.1 putative virus X resistance protein-like, coiled-coil [Helianthus annuus]
MAEEFVKILMNRVTSVLIQHVKDEFNQVVNVDSDMNELVKTLKSIQAILHDAEKKQIENENIKAWLKDLKLTSYDIDDALTNWNTAVDEVNGNTTRSNLRNKMYLAFVFPCFCSNRMTPLRKVAIQIRNINQTLASIDTRKNTFQFVSVPYNQNDALIELQSENLASSYADPSMIYGRDRERDDLLSKLATEDGPPIVFIWGMGGIGKTTLAQLIFNSVEKFILVLDDVWEVDVVSWKPLLLALNEGAPGSKILITSRNEEVGRKINGIMDTFMHPLGVLSDEDSWTIFKRFAFAGKSDEFCENLEDVGKKVSDKCRGLPLASETVGSFMVLKDTKEEWEHVLNDKIWQLELEDRVSNPLMLSYYDLSPAVKRCFCYCANFPKGTKIDAVNLIQIWMAQGYLYDGTVDMEITGRRHLNSLVTRSLFQDPERDKDSRAVLSVKMHDMVHDVASYLMENECLMVTEMPNKVRENRHLTVTLEDDTTFPSPPKQSKKLYTFSIQSFHDCPQIVVTQDCVTLPPEFFNNFKYLKTLDMSRNMLLVIPNDVDKLKNLCYLNLSHNPFYELPETLCNLPNLQTLKLIACYHLTKLPQSIGKLEKLRHLEIDETRSLVSLPKAVANLTSLRTLSRFLIGNDDEACSLGDLKNLNHLRGRLEIEGLNQTDVSEAKEAELEKKEHVSDLNINCLFASSVIDGLGLNPTLEVLRIDKYGGQGFPNWMADLTKLKKVRLHEWANCINLPPLGKLPLLKVLHIEGFKAITHVGSEFLGVSSSLSSTTAFPKLEKLKFSHMERWEEWNIDMMKDSKIMPCIRYLNLSQCDKLQSLPQKLLGLPIKKLRIRKCPFLKQRYQKETGVSMDMVSHISNVRIQ